MSRSSKKLALLAAALGLAGCATKPAPAPQAAGRAPAPAATVAPAPAPAPLPAVPGRQTPDAAFRQQAPTAGPEPTFTPPHWKRFKLKNGLEVFLVEFHDLPLIDFNLMIKTGGAANPADRAGLADLTANMLDEGTKSRSAPEIADQIAALGATLSTGSTWDASNVSLTTLSRNLDPALAIFADVIQNPAFDPKDFGRVRDNLVTAIARRKDSPPTVASLALTRLLYGTKHPYGWPASGADATIKKLTPADLRTFYQANYRPNNAALIVAGDTTEQALRSKLEAAFKPWRGRHVGARKLPAPVAAATGTKIFLIDKADAPQSSIRIGLVGIERQSADYFPVTVMNLIFGGGFYRLDLNLREGKGWTYGARSSFDSRRTPGPFSAGGEFVAPHSADSVAEILKELNNIRDSDVTDAELSRAKDQIIKSFPARFATRANVAAQLAELAVFGFPDSYVSEYTHKIAAVTKDDVRRVARKYLDPNRLAIVVVGDRKSIEAPLAKLAPVELRDLEGDPIAAVTPGDTAAGEPIAMSGHHHDHGHDHAVGGGHGAQPPVSGPPPIDLDGCCQSGNEDAILQARAERRQRVRRVFWVTFSLNAVVAISKAVYSAMSGSLTLGADSLHAALDASSNVLALLSLGWAAAPADPRHPYGRQKIEIIAALGIGVLIVGGLLEFAEAAIRGLQAGRASPAVGWVGFAVVLGTMAINLFVGRYEHHKGHELGSELLHADAHHAHSDFYASAAVLASFVAGRFGVKWADSAATLLLVPLIGQAAWKVFRDNVPILIDAARLDPVGVADLARSVRGVSDVHRVRSRGMRSAVELDLHLEVAPEMSVIEAHRLAQQIERELKVKFPEVSDVVIHVEPTSR